jgi:hypothetical protein
LDFEVQAEEELITPPWLIEQAVVKDYLTVLQKSIGLLLKANKRLYGAWYKKSTDAKHPWAAAVVLNRQGEYLAKLLIHFDKIALIEAEYESARVLQDILGWPAKQADVLKEQIIAIQQEHEIAVAKEAHSLVGLKRPSHVPDFAGEFLCRTAQMVLEALCRNDVPVFSAVFPLFFQASIKKTTALLNPSEGDSRNEERQLVNLAMGPLFDLIELSGYANLISELHQSAEPWSIARALWDRYLLDETTGPKRMEFLTGALQMADIPALVAPGELLRTGWRMEVHRLLKGLPTTRVVHGGYGIHVEERVNHASALVRVLAREIFAGFYRGIDVFSATYFVKLAGKEAAVSELRSSNLIEAIQRESGGQEGEQGGSGEESGG